MNRYSVLLQAEPTSSEEEARLARISLLGHDVRAALSDILGGLRLLPDVAEDPTIQTQLDRVRAASDQLARLLEEGIELLVEEAGVGEPYPLLLVEFLDQLEQRWRGVAHGAGMRFAIGMSPGLPQTLLTDRLALERIMSNLIANAITHGGRGTVRVYAEMSGTCHLLFRICDEGPGFDALSLDHLFEPGWRGTHGLRQTGEGLGLFIARGLIHKLGGNVEARNRPEGGAELRVELPLSGRASLPAPYPQSEPPLLPDLTDRKVLVADDSLTNCAVLEQMLRSLGADVHSVSDGNAAVEALLAEPFDLALLDIEMPGRSGLDAIATLRASATDWADLPILACTAFVLRTNREAILAAGADGILAKPINGIVPLGHAISEALEQKSVEWAMKAHSDELLFTEMLARGSMAEKREIASRIVGDLTMVERALVAARAPFDRAMIRRHCHMLGAVAETVGEHALARESRALLNAARHGSDDNINDLSRVVRDRIDRLIHNFTKLLS